MSLSRRTLFASTAALGAALAACTPPRAPSAPAAATPFNHGVASGDPLSDRIILWTRVTPAGEGEFSGAASKPVSVRWQIATDADFNHVVNQGELQALPLRDFTVKVDALGLTPGMTYYYRFEAAGHMSPVGRTRSLPVGPLPRARLAVVNCSNFPFGFFNVYAHIAARADLDAVLHLGDYLYEYGINEYGNGEDIGRAHSPRHEIVTLADYRARHAQYKGDPDLQQAHRQHPWIVIWDDHETANDSYANGAENHQPRQGEGNWQLRKAAATRAYAEWMPIRELTDGDGLRVFRRFAFGDLIDLIMLDTRLHGRVAPVRRGGNRSALDDASRSILGADQAAWLNGQLSRSKERGGAWRVLGQQVMLSQLWDEQRTAVNFDQWDGYPFSRSYLLDHLAAQQIRDVVVLTGDVHSAWALDVAADPFGGTYNPSNGSGSLAVEMIAPSITSPSPFGNGQKAQEAEQRWQGLLPNLRWNNFRQRGYLLLDVDKERAQGEWYLVEHNDTRGVPESLGAVFATARNANHLIESEQTVDPIADRAPLAPS